MWPFKRSNRPPEHLALPDQWSIAEGVHDGRPLIVRRRGGLKHVVGYPAYSSRVSVAVPLRAPDSNGFPEPAESAELAALEDLLVQRLEANRESAHVLTISTGGMREFVFYTRDPEHAFDMLREVESAVHSYELQFVIEPDPKWAVYRQFA